MQRQLLKILIILLPLISAAPAAFSQVSSFRLKQADSLYQAKRYTQSLEHYQAILAQKQFTPAMLLRMAYIEEGLNRVGQALYYLNLYYIVSNDKSVLDKMEELAAKFSLEGYKSSDSDRALSFYNNYKLPISAVLAVTSIFFLSLLIYKRRKGRRSMATVVFLFTSVIALAVQFNIGDQIASGIIGEPNTYLMEGPSAGASVVSVINEGHRLEIIGKVDVWYKVKWDGNTVFVRDHNLLPVGL